jgi:gamma-glutamyltranspeptidase/glutathione hydrolase
MHRVAPLPRNAALALLLLAAAGCARDSKPDERWRYADVAPPLVQPHVMAVSDNPASSEVGAEIMRRGGNAIDAIVAVAFAQAVVNPAAGNLGGGGFLVYRQHGGEVFALDFREAAPLAATPAMYVDSTGKVGNGSILGARAGGVPGSVAGLWAMHKRFGVLPWRVVVEPSVMLAKAHVLDSQRAEWLAGNASTFALFPSSAAVFLRADGRPWRAGDTLYQADLARTLALIADSGADVFYRGGVARKIATQVQLGGGLITEQDLAQYQALWRTPLETTYRDWRVVTMPPVSGGGTTLIEALNILEGYQLPPAGTAALAHLQVEALRRAFLDRNSLLGDPAFVNMPIAELTSKQYATAQRASIVADRATPLAGSTLAEGMHTTHFSVVDSAGNAAAITTTINTGFGSGFVVAGAGFLLNNEMDDFTTQPGVVNAMGIKQEGQANTIQPGKRMLSSMTPTIVLDPQGQLSIVLGSPGGATIISSVMEVISNVVDQKMTLAQAVAAPRIHHNGLPDVVGWEPAGLSPAARRDLETMGYALWKEPEFMGTVNAIRVMPEGLEGVPDPRVDGGAAGW